MHTLDKLANYVLYKFSGNVTPMKLQKLLYYIKVWTTVSGNSVIPDTNDQKFEAWKFGPVNPNLYHKFKHFGSKAIEKSQKIPPFIYGKDKKLIDFILDSYGNYSAITLSKTTHIEEPWIKNSKVSGIITDEDILDYYSKESFVKNFPLGSNDKYYPPKTSSHYAYVFDMKKDDEASEVTFNSIEEYKSQFKQVAENIEEKFNIN